MSRGSVLKRVYAEPVTVGHCISVLLDHASNPTFGHALTKAALSSLSALAGLDLTPITRSADLLQATPPGSKDFLPAVMGFAEEVEKIGAGEEWMADVIPSFLPGLCSSITKMVASDKTTTSPLVSHGLVTWAHYVGVAMGGEPTPIVVESMSAKRDDAGSSYQPDTGAAASAIGRKSLLVKKSSAWERATSARLHTLAQKMTVLVTAEMWRTRLFLAGWAHALLTHANR